MQFAVIFRRLKDQADGAVRGPCRRSRASLCRGRRLTSKEAARPAARRTPPWPCSVWAAPPRSGRCCGTRPGPEGAAELPGPHRLAPPLWADPATIAHRLDNEQDVTIRRALADIELPSEFTEQALPTAARRCAPLPKLREIYGGLRRPGVCTPPPSGCFVNGSRDDWLAQTNAAWAKENRLDRIRRRTWKAAPKAGLVLVHSQRPGPDDGRLAPGPVEVMMGSPMNEVDRNTDENQHTRRIGRTFALSAKAGTVEQFRALYKKHESEEYELPEKYTCLPSSSSRRDQLVSGQPSTATG